MKDSSVKIFNQWKSMEKFLDTEVPELDRKEAEEQVRALQIKFNADIKEM